MLGSDFRQLQKRIWFIDERQKVLREEMMLLKLPVDLEGKGLKRRRAYVAHRKVDLMTEIAALRDEKRLLIARRGERSYESNEHVG